MKKIASISFALFLVAGSAFYLVKGQSRKTSETILYFNPEIYPDIIEIQEATNDTFFDALTNWSKNDTSKIVRLNNSIPFDTEDTTTLKEYCMNNNAEFVVIPKIKYFKVGIGKLVLSNQVIVTLKLYNKEGQLISEASHDTYKKNGRLLGSAENSIEIGTKGALKTLRKNLKKSNIYL